MQSQDEMDSGPRATALALLARTPAAARRIRYLGPAPEDFRAAHLARNPQAIVDVEPDADAAFEVVVAADLAAALDAAAPLAPEPGGLLVAALNGRDAGRLAELAPHGLEIVRLHALSDAGGYFDDAASDRLGAWRAGQLAGDALVVVARRGAGPAPLHVRLVTFAPTLMDIRTRLPAEMLRTEPELVVAHGKPPQEIPSLPPDQPKVLVLQRPGPRDPELWRRAAARQIADGWITVLEYDDHPELVALHNKRALSPADWIRFSGVHAVQTTTAPLVDLFRGHNPEVKAFPNAVFSLRPLPEAASRRVFYGAVSRGPFAARVAASLGPAVQAVPDMEIFVVGDRAVFDALPTPRKRFFDFMPYEDYLALMGLCAVSLSPIEGSLHQETKSDAKFLDAASQGVLTIASPTIYASTIRHGENGLIASQATDWSGLLTQALTDTAATRRMAHQAWSEVRERRMFAHQVRARRDWYRDLWDRRDALNAALRARLGL
jgi:hypothetical protein